MTEFRPATSIVERLRAALDAAGYVEPAIDDFLGRSAQLSENQVRAARIIASWRARDSTPLATLVRLFLLDEAIDASSVKRALSTLSTDEALDCGLLQAVSNGLRAAVRIAPFQGLRIASDWSNTAGPGIEPVMGVAASSRAIAQMLIKRQVEQALDLGTGSGVLAMLAARNSDHIRATDLNSRAIALAQFNARLNGVHNIEFQQGDLFKPVEDRTFDFIVCNPPFVIAPQAGQMHSQTGLPADDFLRSIVRAAPRYLRIGGYCQLVGNWIQPVGGDWRSRLSQWLEGSGCDAWVLQSRIEQAEIYAQARILEQTDDPQEASRRFENWMSYYQSAGIEAIVFGVITMRRSNRRDCWFQCSNMPPVTGDCGSAIEQIFVLRDFLNDYTDDQLLFSSRFRRADDLRWDRQSDMSDAGWNSTHSQLRLTNELMFAGAVDSDVAEFVGQCTGANPLGEDFTRLAAKLGRDSGQFAKPFLALVRRLIALGILLPVEQDAPRSKLS